MRRLLFWLVLAASPQGLAAQESPVAEGSGRTELEELLRLPARYWSGARSVSESLGGALERYELTPELGGVVSGSGFGAGVRQHLYRDRRSVLGWSALATYKGYTDLDLFYLRELDEAGRFLLKTDLRHRDLADERFYGVGLATEEAHRSDFRLSETSLRSQMSVALSEGLRLYLGGDVRRLESSFEASGALEAPSFAGDPSSFQYGSVALGLGWDTRDVPSYARRGSYVGGELRQFIGLGAGSPSFRRLSLELQNVLPLSGRDHVLATRLRADLMDHEPAAHVPFFFTQGLGGSHSLRGFSLNRYRGYDRLLATLEYRHRVLGDKLDAVVFWDTGGVYDEMSAMTPGGLRHAYGAGIRVIKNRRVLLRLELAGGAEGPRFLVSFSSSF